jgi:SOS-response transcriptional repressor LexA
MTEINLKYGEKATKNTLFVHNVGPMLRALMAAKGIDDAQLSRAIGIASSSLSRIKNDPACNPTLASLKPIADYFSITVSQLIGETALNKARVKESSRKQTWVVNQIPIIAWNQIAAFKQDELKEFTEWLPSNRALTEDAFVLCIEANTWGDLFAKGSFLIIDSQPEPLDGDTIIVHSNIDDQYVAKKLLLDGREQYLQSLNPALQKTDILNHDETIVGVVVEIRQELK